MKNRNYLKMLFILLAFFYVGDNAAVSADNGQKRIKFQVTAIGEGANERKILSQTTIEGVPGTDFDINLQTENFKMQSRFLNDLVSDEKLKIRARIETRRFYGLSPANLPLYEEDSQKQTFEIGFNETLVLLPLGKNENDETLKIEIVPSLFYVAESKEKVPIKIDFDKMIESNEISIQARKIPHNFTVEAVLTADGKEIAKGSGDLLLERESEIALQAIDEKQLSAEPFKVKVTVDKFSRNRPKDLVGIKFDFYKGAQPILSNSAGINLLGENFVYAINSNLLPDDKNFELKFRIKVRDENE